VDCNKPPSPEGHSARFQASFYTKALESCETGFIRLEAFNRSKFEKTPKLTSTSYTVDRYSYSSIYGSGCGYGRLLNNIKYVIGTTGLVLTPIILS
jgi:hypothetical protein